MGRIQGNGTTFFQGSCEMKKLIVERRTGDRLGHSAASIAGRPDRRPSRSRASWPSCCLRRCRSARTSTGPPRREIGPLLQTGAELCRLAAATPGSSTAGQRRSRQTTRPSSRFTWPSGTGSGSVQMTAGNLNANYYEGGGLLRRGQFSAVGRDQLRSRDPPPRYVYRQQRHLSPHRRSCCRSPAPPTVRTLVFTSALTKAATTARARLSSLEEP